MNNLKWLNLYGIALGVMWFFVVGRAFRVGDLSSKKVGASGAWIFLYESSNHAQIKLDIDDEQIGGSIHSFKETTKINKESISLSFMGVFF